jgi:hypothetical protein
MGSNGIGDLNDLDFISGGMYPGSQVDHSAYADPTQLPLAAQAVRADYDPETNPLTGEATSRFAKGGIAALHFDGTEGSQVEDIAPTEPAPPPTMSELADQLKLAYRTNTNYDDLYKQFAATKGQDPTQWYKHQLDFLGQQQGWQIGQNRSDRLASIQPQIDSTIQQAKDAGVSDKEIKSILGNSSQEGRNANVQRIANDAANGGSGFNFQKDLQPGLTYLALATAAGLTAQPELLGLGEAGTAAVPLADITGSTFASPAFALPEAATTIAPAVASAAPAAGGITALDAGTQAAINSAAAGSTGAQVLPYGITSVAPATSSTMIPGAAALGGSTAGAIGGGGVTTAGMTTGQKLAALSLATRAMGGSGGGGSAGPSSTTTQAPPMQTMPSTQFNPSMSMPNMFAMNNPPLGSSYQPYTYRYAQGGVADLGGYAAGGKLLKGPGDGMSDSIEANIAGKQPARLADGEFVVPADVVSHLGNGSTDAGAKHLYRMMDRIRQARTGNSKQGKRINPDKFLPKG